MPSKIWLASPHMSDGMSANEFEREWPPRSAYPTPPPLYQAQPLPGVSFTEGAAMIVSKS